MGVRGVVRGGLAAGMLIASAVGFAQEVQSAPPPPPVSGVAGQAVQLGVAGMPGGQDQRPGPTGSVTGRMVLGDTQAPARFAQVTLVPVAAVQADGRPGGGFRGGFGGGGNGRTDLDGNFTISNVAVGDYYVTGQAAGYISESAILQARAADGADAQALLAGLPTVRVAAGGISTVNVSLTRGGTIAGRLQWDDGSPATLVQVSAVMVSVGTSATAGFNQMGRGGVQGLFMMGGSAGGMTDDRGDFRLTGLVPGTYTVRVMVQAPMTGGSTSYFQRTQSITLYAPGKVRRTDAQTFTIHAGEERADLQMVLSLRSLHTVSGRVGAASGPEPQSGTVRIVDMSDATLSRFATMGPDGSFALTYLPAGTYTLSVTGASTTPTSSSTGRRGGNGSSSQGSSFAPFSETLTVTDTDVSGVAVNLSPASE